MNIQNTIGNNVRGYRHKKDWTQEELAARCKMNSQFISRLELGHKLPTLRTMVTIAKELGVDLYLFFIENSYKK